MNIFETPCLILRTWREGDLDPMSLIDQEEKVCQFLPGIGNRCATKQAL